MGKAKYMLKVRISWPEYVCTRHHPIPKRRHYFGPVVSNPNPGPFVQLWNTILESIPVNHNFNQGRKTKIVMGKKNAWPLPKSKGNRF